MKDLYPEYIKPFENSINNSVFKMSAFLNKHFIKKGMANKVWTVNKHVKTCGASLRTGE